MLGGSFNRGAVCFLRPAGNVPGDRVICGHPVTFKEYARMPAQMLLSVDVTVKLKFPPNVGDPDNKPEEESDTPPGNEPTVTVKLYGVTPPLAVMF